MRKWAMEPWKSTIWPEDSGLHLNVEQLTATTKKKKQVSAPLKKNALVDPKFHMHFKKNDLIAWILNDLPLLAT